MSGVLVRAVLASDAARLVEIYNHYVLHTAISFEEAAISAADMAVRIDKVQQLKLPWLVAERDGVLFGYAYAGLWRERHAYRFAVESTVYVAHDAGVRGIGAALYSSLFDMLRKAGYHTVLGVIALPNAASIALHEKFGMRQVAHFREVGFKFGKWHDVGNWQVVL
ncbi:MAG: N-acetyltransferase [Rhodoferax sp.]|nr:N-acetyltransferase [Rhodoferax sp.]MBP9929984.1 N-acetyltransferase [Rhodoferax sp.]HQX61541.1 N-acetyltransferase family protein [Burkholderiaceae bacterium]HQZ05955.1 N-acetyltransferase family protein [Burkholderiaceae bacterium]